MVGILYKKWTTDEDIEEGYMNIDDVITHIPAGIVDTVVKLILKISGALDIDKFIGDLTNAREEAMHDLENRITSLISSVFRVSKKEFDAMTWNQVLGVIAQGELVLGGKIPEVPFVLTEKEENKPFDFENDPTDKI